MAKKQTVAQQINTKINSFLRSDRAKRDQLQELIEITRDHAEKHGDFTLLSKLITGLQENKSRNLKAITAYIQAFTTGIEWSKNGYKKSKGATIEFKAFDCTWFDFKANKDGNKVAKVDAISRVKSLLATLEKALEEGTLKEGQEEQANKITKALHAFTS